MKIKMGTMISNIFPKNVSKGGGKGGWVGPTWNKILNSNVSLEGIPNIVGSLS